MRVHFIDTSVFTNILNVPNRNQQRAEIMAELTNLENSSTDLLILPFAAIIETGNHIAHNGDGNQRRKAAEDFSKVIIKTIRDEAPWHYYGRQLTEDDLNIICKDFPDSAMRGEGFGDLSIIRAFERFKNETPGIERIRIWSLDTHLSSYDEEIAPIKRRNQEKRGLSR